MRDLRLWVEEIYIDGAVAFRCSDSTLYRWVKEINEYLEREKCEWRVRANRKERTIEVVTQ